MASIVEYSCQRRPVNAYPKRIVSPISPGPCCATRMEQVGEVEEERGWPFFYKRCRVCGYTIRHFLSRSPELVQER